MADAEIWKDIEGYEGLYQVSNLGRVRSMGNITHKGIHILKPAKDKGGYLFATLCKNGIIKRYKIHRLVAKAFIPNPDNLPQVNHKSEVKTENFVENLEWCDAKYNINYGTGKDRRSTSNGKEIICVDTGLVFNTVKQASEYYKINPNAIGMCARGIHKSAGGFKWRYAS